LQRLNIFMGQSGMNVKIIISSIFFLYIHLQIHAQACTTLGQTPYTAFPVCGTSTFSQATVPICQNSTMVVPGCTGGAGNVTYGDKNPFWYQFTCYQAGTLGLLITPNNSGDDYDWQLFDITGVTNLNSVYTDPSLFVIGNWAGTFGLTGASAAGTTVVECASDPVANVPSFSKMPVLQLGHTYLLMVSHFSDSQSGYQLSFGGGTGSITDPTLPDLKSASSSCDATKITVKLNKKVKCSTLAADGSDFTIAPAAATVISATGLGCTAGFDLDSVTLLLSNPLPAGNYTLIIKNGTDANTLRDNCDHLIPAGNTIPLVISPIQPTPMDSLTTVSCAPGQLQLVFKKNIRCSSIAADGSDFIVTGPGAVTVSSASGVCSNGLSSSIVVKLASPIVTGGVYQLTLKRGTDGNTIIDECGQETPAGSSLPFITKDTVSAAFNYTVLLGCKTDTVQFAHNGAHGVNNWFWRFDVSGGSTQQNPQIIFQAFGQKQISLIVSNGFCSDTVVQTLALNNELKAIFTSNPELCPEDSASFINNSLGAITNYSWNFGNGNTSALKDPTPQHYPKTGGEKSYPVQLIVQNNGPCYDTAIHVIKVLRTCYIAVPNAFTPNGDKNNDYLYPLNAYKADNLEFNVYNRLGQLVFHTTDWTQKWDGTIGGKLQSSGTYVWTLRYTHHDTGKKFSLKGTSVLIR
jgi:gliding motility-associated-like protein